MASDLMTPAQNYVTDDMDGKSSLVSQVFHNTIINKRMIIINSIGNEENNL